MAPYMSSGSSPDRELKPAMKVSSFEQLPSPTGTCPLKLLLEKSRDLISREDLVLDLSQIGDGIRPEKPLPLALTVINLHPNWKIDLEMLPENLLLDILSAWRELFAGRGGNSPEKPLKLRSRTCRAVKEWKNSEGRRPEILFKAKLRRERWESLRIESGSDPVRVLL